MARRKGKMGNVSEKKLTAARSLCDPLWLVEAREDAREPPPSSFPILYCSLLLSVRLSLRKRVVVHFNY